jgi:hypothetical protein
MLAELRQFHRATPLAPGMRVDTLIRRVREAVDARPRRHRGAGRLTLTDAELRIVLASLEGDGRIVRTGRRVSLSGRGAGLDPVMLARIDVLLAGLRAAGASPPAVEGPAARLGIPRAIIEQLRAGRVLVRAAPGIDYPADVWDALQARVETLALHGPVTVARVRDALGTSRRHAAVLLAARAGRSGPVDRRRTATRELSGKRAITAE